MLSAVSLLLVGCANYDSDINRIDEELDRIENTRIKSLSEQIDRINVSLPELERTDKDLKDMIKSLEGTAGDLQKAIAENGTKIEAVNADLAKALDELRNTDTKDKEEVMAALTAAKAEIIARLDAMKTEAEKKLEAVNGTIAALQEKDTQLEKKISDLKDYADKCPRRGQGACRQGNRRRQGLGIGNVLHSREPEGYRGGHRLHKRER